MNTSPRGRRGLLTAALLGWSLSAMLSAARTSAEPVGHNLERQVLSLERQICDAVLHRDVKAVADSIADDVTYVHASGLLQGKTAYLAYVAAGSVTYTSYAIEHPRVRIVGDAAVTHGVLAYQSASHQSPARGELLYTAVYVRTDGRWRLTSWETTPKAP